MIKAVQYAGTTIGKNLFLIRMQPRDFGLCILFMWKENVHNIHNVDIDSVSFVYLHFRNLYILYIYVHEKCIYATNQNFHDEF